MASLRILVVDTDRAALSFVDGILGKRGHEVRTAPDGQTALNVASGWDPDLILLDPDLPIMDGYLFVRLLRARPGAPVTPVIFLAPRKEVQERLAGFHLDADGFMHKPVDPQELEIGILACMKRKAGTERRLRRAPRDPGEEQWTVRMSGMRGGLDLIGLPTILNTIEMDSKTGVLVVVADDLEAKARLEFQLGRLVRATLDGRDLPRNCDLVYLLIPCTKGKFDFRPGAVTSPDEIKTPTSSLILEGARRADEGKRPGGRA